MKVTKEIRARVFAAGNRLAVRMNRAAAFAKAWEIVLSSSVELPLRGVLQGSRQEALRRLNTYDPSMVHVFIAPETENPVDNRAARVMVLVQNTRTAYTLGYLPREYAPAAASLRAASIRVLDGDIRGGRVAVRL
ncbi:hypothetical protein FACS1894130_07650 [Spirochaetia bacterium]|nr:hypothetical protein FACS1894130_07650 [Spirochaetia bacterium]